MPITYPTTSFKLKRTSRVGVLGTMFDLDLGEDGGAELVEDSKELTQSVALRLLMVKGEAWEDPSCGLPWFDLLGAKPRVPLLLRHELLQQTRLEQRIRQVDVLEIKDDNYTREVRVKMYAKARDGSQVRVEL